MKYHWPWDPCWCAGPCQHYDGIPGEEKTEMKHAYIVKIYRDDNVLCGEIDIARTERDMSWISGSKLAAEVLESIRRGEEAGDTRSTYLYVCQNAECNARLTSAHRIPNAQCPECKGPTTEHAARSGTVPIITTTTHGPRERGNA